MMPGWKKFFVVSGCALQLFGKCVMMLPAFSLAMIIFYPAGNVYASNNFQAVDQLIGDNDSVLISDPAGKVIYSKNAEKKLIPASSLKVLTALAAFHYLHRDFRFSTEFYLDENSNLEIKGYGDPLLISENVRQISFKLVRRLASVKNIVLDDSYFEKPIIIPGIFHDSFEPYNAPNGALNVNFNTINFAYKNGEYVSAEPQTPFLPIARRQVKDSGLTSGRIPLSDRNDESTYYAGQLFAFFLQSNGLKISGGLKIGIADEKKDRMIYRNLSEFTLEDIIGKLFAHSNNYIANQILLSIGAKVFGPPATLEKGVNAVTAYAESVLGIKNISIAEGSGVSRKNRLSAIMFLRILNAFYPYRDLMRRNINEYYKTGTLDGVRTRVGYIETQRGEVYRYVVMLNTPGKVTDSIMAKIKQCLN